MDPTETQTASPAPTRLQRARWPLLILGPLVAIAAGVYFYVSGGRFESTDDAYVMAARVAISANVAGRVVEVAVHDNQRIHRGDLLYRLDDTSLRIAVHEAEAQLAASVMQIDSLKANWRQRQSELAAARDTLAFQKSEHSFDEARSRVSGVQHEIAAVVAQLGGNPAIEPAQHPMVRQAQAALDRAQLNLSYAEIRAPSDGVVTRVEQLQVGNYIPASTPVFALVSIDDIWVEANFKEDQLGHMQVGQRVNVRIDSYSGRDFEGTVASVSPGTGSQFSALPAENASGNWVKVVQRVPVRIELRDLDANVSALHMGLSASVNVDTRYQRRLFGANVQLAPEAERTARR